MLRVLEYGNPILRKKSKAVNRIDKDLKKLLEEMVYTMRNHRIKGCGLAGPQVGYSLRIAVIEPEKDHVYYLINPVIVSGKGSITDSEGCLSVPGVYGKVKRNKSIKYQSLDIKTGKKLTYEATGFPAIVIQHEIDHLNGILFTDYIPNLKDLEFSEGEKIPPKFLEKYRQK
ncbi:MAG: peptide deformylase [Caldisericia bacterium]|nr:peptide deformylase [Caldisericia bacterium]